MKLQIKGSKETDERVLELSLEYNKTGKIELQGRFLDSGLAWVIATITPEGNFQPIKGGLAKFALSYDSRYM